MLDEEGRGVSLGGDCRGLGLGLGVLGGMVLGGVGGWWVGLGLGGG